MEDKTLEQHMDTVFRLFRQHNVENVYLFGSALAGDFSSASDIDLLVNFGEVEPEHYFDNYMDLKMKLEKIFNRSVDLVEEKTVKNPVMRRTIDRNKKLIYGRTSGKMDV
jgi:predicted nucleotidyltransferase